MAYGHAERNLALLRQLVAETRQLLKSREQPDSEHSAWLQEVTTSGDNRDERTVPVKRPGRDAQTAKKPGLGAGPGHPEPRRERRDTSRPFTKDHAG